MAYCRVVLSASCLLMRDHRRSRHVGPGECCAHRRWATGEAAAVSDALSDERSPNLHAAQVLGPWSGHLPRVRTHRWIWSVCVQWRQALWFRFERAIRWWDGSDSSVCVCVCVRACVCVCLCIEPCCVIGKWDSTQLLYSSRRYHSSRLDSVTLAVLLLATLWHSCAN